MDVDKAIQLYTIDYYAQETGFISAPHTHDQVELFYFLAGEGIHYIDFLPYPIQQHSVFLVSQHQVHYIQAPAYSHNVGYVITLDPLLLDLFDPDFRQMFGSFTQLPTYYLSDETAELLKVAFRQFDREVRTSSPKKGFLLKLFTELILTYTFRANQQSSSANLITNKFQEQFQRFTSLLEQNFRQNHSVHYYADRLSVTAKQLNRTCQKAYHQTTLTLIHQRVSLEAKRLLFYTAEPVKVIAYQLGFQDPAHFTNFFRRHTALSPESFRHQMAQIRK